MYCTQIYYKPCNIYVLYILHIFHTSVPFNLFDSGIHYFRV
nr:MAG TPA: hypothetical protein [Caudoviricetes sp.]